MQAAVTLEFINEFYEQWTAALTTVGILNRETAGDHTNYAINADAIWVAKYVNEFACTQCEDVLYSHDDLEMADDACCLSHRCTGHYKATPQTVKTIITRSITAIASHAFIQVSIPAYWSDRYVNAWR